MNTTVEIQSVAGSLTVQDHGRAGYQRFGVAEGGAMDRFALYQGAALLDNDINDAALEMAGAGASFAMSGEPGIFACTGAPMTLRLNNRALPWNSSFRVTAGDLLEIGPATQGVYGYLHASGGFDVPAILGSRATHSRACFGGFQGRALAAGDRLLVCAANAPTRLWTLPQEAYFDADEIRIVAGVQAHLFDQTLHERFLSTRFIMSLKRDRMGARLESGSSTFLPQTGLTGVSDAVLAGDVQIAGDGFATVLLADRQPTGGYPRIATVITADLNKVAQLRSGQQFHFSLLDLAEAVDALREYQRTISRLKDTRQALVRDPAEIPDLLQYNLIDGVITGNDADRA